MTGRAHLLGATAVALAALAGAVGVGLGPAAAAPRAAVAHSVADIPSGNAGDIDTVEGGLGSGPATSVSQSPYFSVHYSGTGIGGGTGNWLYVADFANNVVRQVNLATGQETVVAGNGLKGHTGAQSVDYYAQPATDVSLNTIAGLAVDPSGDLYIADQENNQVVEVAAVTGYQWPSNSNGTHMIAGDAYTVVGGTPFYPPADNHLYCGAAYDSYDPVDTEQDGDGDGCLAQAAFLGDPSGLAFYGGNLYISDQFSEQVRVVMNASCTSSCPFGLTDLSADHIYNVVGCQSPVPLQSSPACWTSSDRGSGDDACAPAGANFTSANGTAASAALIPCPQGITFDHAGDLFIGEDLNVGASVLEVPYTTCSSSCPFGMSAPLTAGDVYTVAGDGSSTYTGDQTDYATTSATCPSGLTDAWGDGCPATEINLTDPSGQYVDESGNLLTVNYYNNVVQSISAATGTVSLVAGEGPTDDAECGGAGALGAGCLSTQTAINLPTGLTDDGEGDLVISDGGGIRSVAGALADSAPGTVSAVAGTGFSGLFNNVFGVDAEPFPVGAAGFSGDAPNTLDAAQTELNGPEAVAFDGQGDLFIADTANDRVRMVPSHSGLMFGQTMTAGDSYTVAGTGQEGVDDDSCTGQTGKYTTGTIAADPVGDGCFGYFGEVDRPSSLAVDAQGDLFIADTKDDRVRMIPADSGTYYGQYMYSGSIYTVAGGGSGTCTGALDAQGDGCVGYDATLSGPEGVAVDAQGDVIISDTGDNEVRRVAPGGVITVFAGDGGASTPDYGGAAITSALPDPTGIAVDGYGNVAVSLEYSGAGAVAEIPSGAGTHFGVPMGAGDVYRVAGQGPVCGGAADAEGDGCPGTESTLSYPRNLAVDPAGNLFIADAGDGLVRQLSAGGTITDKAGGGTPPCTQAAYESDITSWPYPVCQETTAAGALPGDGGPATAASLVALSDPSATVLNDDPCATGGPTPQPPGGACGVAVDPIGNLYIADTATNRVRVVFGASTPQAPGGVGALGGTGDMATVTWSALSGFEGYPPSSYTVTASPGGDSVTVAGTSLSATVTGLAPGQTYTFTVQAANLGGTGPPSAPSNPISTPAAAAPYSNGTTVQTEGYRFVAADGGIFSFGSAAFEGTPAGTPLVQPIVGMATTPTGGGYWLVASDGGIFNYGDAAFYGSTGSIHLNQPIVGMASVPAGGGYWLVASDGGIFSFGAAHFFGSTGGIHLNKPIVGMAATPDGRGYWLVASDGGIFAFGDAAFHGSTGSLTLNKPIVGMAATPDGAGYWLVASDGGIFAFGDAAFHGSTGSLTLNKPIVGMASSPDGAGYWLVASDGGIFSFGDAAFDGSTGSLHLVQPIVGMSAG